MPFPVFDLHGPLRPILSNGLLLASRYGLYRSFMGVDLGTAFDILLDSGVEVVGGDGERVLIGRRGSRALRYQIVVAKRVDDSERVLSDLEVAAQRGDLLLYLVERATDALWQAAETGDVAFVAVRDRLCSVAGRTWPEQAEEPPRPNFRLCALARVLLSTSTPMFQGAPSSRAQLRGASFRSSLAHTIGVSQPHVSVLLRQLPVGSVEQVAGGWEVRNFDRLWDWHKSAYSGPGGIRIAWRSDRKRTSQLNDLKKVAGDAAVALNHGRKSARILLSGFEAVPAPLRGTDHTPVVGLGEQPLVDFRGPVTIFSRYITSSLTEMRYTRCPQIDATVQLVQPTDPTVYSTAAAWGDEGRTDPLITAWELTHGAQDNHSQAAALREWARAYTHHS